MLLVKSIMVELLKIFHNRVPFYFGFGNLIMRTCHARVKYICKAKSPVAAKTEVWSPFFTRVAQKVSPSL